MDKTKEKKQEKLIVLLPFIKDIVLKKFKDFLENSYIDRIIEAMRHLISDPNVGYEPLKELWKDDFEKKLKMFERLEEKEDIYDKLLIKEKLLDKKIKELKISELLRAFYYIINKTELKNKIIEKRIPRKHIPFALKLAVFKRDNFRCVVCGKGKESGLHADHKIPVIQGGTDDMENLQTLCSSCNLSKSDGIYEDVD